MTNMPVQFPAARQQPSGGPPPEPPNNHAPMGKSQKPRHTHLQNLMRMGQAVSVLCSIAAGAGMITGLVEPHDGIGALIVPALSGSALTAILAAGWHQTLKVASRVRTTRGYIGAVGACFLCMGFAAGGSSWPITSVLSGRAAGTDGTGSSNTVGTLTVKGTPGSPNKPAFGVIVQKLHANIVSTGGLQISDGTLSDTMASGTVFTANGSSSIANGGTVTLSSGSLATFDVNGTIAASPLGDNVLNLSGVKIGGSGVIVQQGPSREGGV